MPIYEYSCRKCNAHIEILQKITDAPLKRCRKCGGKLEKEWSQTSFQLKGTGWYVTDYAGRKADAKEPPTTGEAKAEGAAAENKAEAKAESKKENKKVKTTAREPSSSKSASAE